MPFFDVGVMVDVGVYPLTIVTSILGPARSVRAWGWELMPERTTVDGAPFRIGSPDLIVAAIELGGGAVMRLTSSFYIGVPAKNGEGIEFHGDDASLALGNFEKADATVELGPYGERYDRGPVARPFAARRGLAASLSCGRDRRGLPHRAAQSSSPRRRDPRGGGDSSPTAAVASTHDDLLTASVMPWRRRQTGPVINDILLRA